MPIDRSKYKDRLQEKTKQIYDRGSGSDFKTIFKPNLGDVIKFFKPKAGQHSVDIIPWEAGRFMPPDSNTPEGDITYLWDGWVHFNVGPQKDSYVCMQKTFKQPCAVCDYIKEKSREEATPESIKLLKSIKPKQRALYYVIVYDSPEEEKKGLQIWNAPHWKMQRILNELSKLPDRGGIKVGGMEYFSDPDSGKTVCFKIVGEQESTDYIGHRLVGREYFIDDKFLIQANEHPIDTLILIPEYDDVKAALFGFGVKPPAEPEAPPAEKGQPNLPLPDEVPPTNQPATGEEDITADIKCPGGGKFGVDIDTLKECGECAVYEKCSTEETRLAEKRKADRAAKKLARKEA
jgi:hypothetical protein